MDWNFYMASIIGFVPSFGILYFTWGHLEGLFSEKKLFFNYFIGWIAGIVVSLFFLIGVVSVRDYLDLSVLYLLFFGFFTELLKYIYLNTPNKRRDYALPYYGFAFGLGISAIWMVSLSYYYFRDPMDTLEYVVAFASFIIMSLALSSIHASTGALLGYGIYKNFWEKYLLQSLGLQMLFNLTLLPYVWNFPSFYYFIGVFIGFPVLYYKVYKGVLIYTIPKKVMVKWRKKQKLQLKS